MVLVEDPGAGGLTVRVGLQVGVGDVRQVVGPGAFRFEAGLLRGRLRGDENWQWH